MNEKEIRRQYHIGAAICTAMAVIIIAIGIAALININASWEDVVHEQMQAETTEIEQRLVRQITRDMGALESMSMLMEDYSPKNADKFAERFYEAKLSNSFVSMAYFGLDGVGVLVNNDKGIQKDVDYHTLGTGVQKIVESAYNGEAEMSSVFDSVVTEHKIIAYAVPVYSNNAPEAVVGVLAATNHLEVFDELRHGEKILSGNGEIHLLNSDGILLMSSYTTENPKNLQSVFFSDETFDYKEQRKIKQAIENRESLFSTLNYDNRVFKAYLYPLEVNDWYLMCVRNQQDLGIVSSQRSQAIIIIFVSLFTVLIALFAYMMRSNVMNAKRLFQIAYEDPVTGAPNMARFLESLHRERGNGSSFAIAALNISQFKFINEVLGVYTANEILRNICKQLGKVLKDGEFYCRDTADLFFLFLRENDEQTVRDRLESITADITRYAVPGQKDYKIRMYAGVYLCENYPGESISTELLVTRTRFALKNNYSRREEAIHFYDAEIHKKAEMEHYVENRMHQALKDHEFRLFLQPKINLKTGELSSAEALVRWITTDGRMIFPDQFIPIFERNGFCIQLDMYMFEQACAQIRSWLDRGVKAIPISVNQTKLLFFDSNYIENLKKILQKYAVPAEMITLEILESLVMEHPDELNRKLAQLREIGFKISMDDFGSGYSSFNTLGNLEIDELKLDRAFLMEGSADSRSDRFKLILAQIIELTKALHITTVAEGVETSENEALIQSLGCDYGQGYLYSRPVSSEDFSDKYMQVVIRE